MESKQKESIFYDVSKIMAVLDTTENSQNDNDIFYQLTKE